MQNTSKKSVGQFPPVKPRFTDYNDAVISDWHRTLGWNMPATDVDCVASNLMDYISRHWQSLFVEYSSARPKAIIEYKHENAKQINYNSHNIQCLREVCAPRDWELPFFLTVYTHDCSQFRVRPMNVAAWQQLSSPVTKNLSEGEYIQLLTKVRNKGK